MRHRAEPARHGRHRRRGSAASTRRPSRRAASRRRGEVEGRYFWDVFIDPAEREGDDRALPRRRARACRPAEYENTFTNARGETPCRSSGAARPIHDETGAVESIVAAGLDVTEHRRQEEEIRASRGRIVAAGDEERRRLERNLHDGAQQRLVSLSLALRLAQAKLDADPAAVAGDPRRRERRARAGARGAARARARHPSGRAHRPRPRRGARGARGAHAARRSSSSAVGRRLPEPIEAAAYYVVSEAVANVVKHASATSRQGRASRR